MAQDGLSLGFFGMFGRSQSLREFDKALRAVDLHPNLVPDAVRLAAVKLIKEHADGGKPKADDYEAAAQILAYCMIGADAFAGANEEAMTGEVERRIEAALDSGDSLDAKLVLLTLHAKVIQPSVVSAFELESAE